MENKELPSEYVSIRAIWLKGIDDCRKAISQRALNESSEMRSEMDAGERTVVHSVNALYLSLVNYGEATIRSDVQKWHESNFRETNKEIWDKTKNLHFPERDTEVSTAWTKTALLSENLYYVIIQTLNKYGMLFQEQPSGYSNVEMKSV